MGETPPYLVYCAECGGNVPAAFFQSHSCRKPDSNAAVTQVESSSVLEEAARIVAGPRQAAYGHPAENHARTAEFWNTYLNWRRRIHGDDYQLDAYDVCHLNDLQKTSRDIHSRQRDNLVDKVGFVANAEMVDE